MDMQAMELGQFAEAFARLANSEAVNALLSEMQADELSDDRRGLYQYLLMNVRNAEAIPALADVVVAEEPRRFQGEAAMALARIGSPEAVMTILKGIDRGDVRDFEHPLIIALKNVQNPDAMRAMYDILTSEENEVSRHAAATVLAREEEVNLEYQDEEADNTKLK